ACWPDQKPVHRVRCDPSQSCRSRFDGTPGPTPTLSPTGWMEVQRMLTDRLDYVIGVDSHRDQHAFAVVTASGALSGQALLAAAERGYRQALALAERTAPGRRLWAIEGTGSYAAGLTGFLIARGERVLEVERPKRSGSRSRMKSDPLDALRAA